jgi:hypothetical protein
MAEFMTDLMRHSLFIRESFMRELKLALEKDAYERRKMKMIEEIYAAVTKPKPTSGKAGE